MATGFDVLASRVVVGKVRPADMTVAAEGLAQGLSAMDDSGYVDPGFAIGLGLAKALLPPDIRPSLTSIDVPAQVDAGPWPQRGARLAKEHSSFPRPAGCHLLDQEVHSGQLRPRKRWC